MACCTGLVLAASATSSTPAGEPGVSCPSILGVRGGHLAAYDVRGGYVKRLAPVPFPHLDGVEWSADGQRWAIWGGSAAAAEASSDLVHAQDLTSQSLLLGGIGAEPRIVPLRRFDTADWEAKEVLLVRWNRRGTELFVACRAARARLPPSPLAFTTGATVCALTDVGGEILAMAPVDGTIASATVSPDDRTWILAPGGEPGAQVLRWKPPEPPRTEAWELPLPGSAQRIVGISEVAWHPADAQRLAVTYRLTPGDSSWTVATIRDDGSAAMVAVRPQEAIRDVRWSPDGTYLSWIMPEVRNYRYRDHPVTIRYDVLWSALPGYEPRVVFNIVDHIELLRPEELSSLAYGPVMEGYAWCQHGVVVLCRYAGRALLPTSALWWVPRGDSPLLLFEDPSWRGPIGTWQE